MYPMSIEESDAKTTEDYENANGKRIVSDGTSMC